MRLYELQQMDVEKQLQDVASGINDQSNAPDMPPGAPPMPGSPDQAMQPSPEEDPMDDLKPVESDLLANTKNLPYVTAYSHDDDSPIHPMRLLNMGTTDLKTARDRVRTKISMTTIKNDFGLYDSPDMKFYRDMISFIEKALEFKKREVGSEPTEPKKPKPKAMKPSGAKPGQVKV
jgi:hypothetical protein